MRHVVTAARGTPASPRPAATVALVRPALGGTGPGPEGSAACEVYLLRRADTLRFAPGYHVFPGGAVDPADGGPAARALLDGTPAPRLPGGGATAAHVVTAVRECFEEAGVLLARDAAGRGAHADPSRAARLDAARRGGQGPEGAAAFTALLRREGLRIDGGALRYMAHWITPPPGPIRFDTRFFLAVLPEGAEPAACGRESVEGGFVGPAAALAADARGDGMRLMDPTATVLRFLAQFGSLVELTAHCDDRTVKVHGFRHLVAWDGDLSLERLG